MILTEQETIKIGEKIKTILSAGIHEVVFEKADGSVRRMACTRDAELLPIKDKEYPDAVLVKEPLHYIRVLEVLTQEWRSFRFDKLISINGLQTETLLVL